MGGEVRRRTSSFQLLAENGTPLSDGPDAHRALEKYWSRAFAPKPGQQDAARLLATHIRPWPADLEHEVTSDCFYEIRKKTTTKINVVLLAPTGSVLSAGF